MRLHGKMRVRMLVLNFIIAKVEATLPIPHIQIVESICDRKLYQSLPLMLLDKRPAINPIMQAIYQDYT